MSVNWEKLNSLREEEVELWLEIVIPLSTTARVGLRSATSRLLSICIDSIEMLASKQWILSLEEPNLRRFCRSLSAAAV